MSNAELSIARFYELILAFGWLAFLLLGVALVVWLIHEIRNPLYVDDHENPIKPPHD